MKKKLQRDLMPRGALRAVLLSLLAEKPAHGYALARSLEERTKGALALREGSLYPALHELELEGLVEVKLVTVEGRKRRIYRLTTAGKREAAAWRDHWIGMADLLRLLFRPSPA